MSVIKLLSLLNILLFVITILLTKRKKNQFFILYIILSFPFLSIPVIYGLNGFVFLTIIYLVFFYKDDISDHQKYFLHQILFKFFLFFSFLGIIFSDFSFNSNNVFDFLDFFSIFIFSSLLISECIRNKSFIIKIFYSFITILVFSFLFLYLQVIWGLEITFSLVQNPNIISSDGLRYPSFFSDPQVYGQYLSVLIFICLLLFEIQKKYTIFYLILIISCLISLFLSGSRGSLLGFIIGYFFLIFFSKRYKRILLFIFSLFFLVIFYVFQNSFIIFNRSTSIDEAYVFRNNIWNSALQIFYKHPFLGIGLGNYSNYVNKFYPDQYWLRDHEFITFDHPESGYLKLLTETGLFGILLIMFLFIVPIERVFFKTGIHFTFENKYLISSVISFFISFYSIYTLGDVRMKILLTCIVSILFVLNNKPISNNTFRLLNSRYKN